MQPLTLMAFETAARASTITAALEYECMGPYMALMGSSYGIIGLNMGGCQNYGPLLGPLNTNPIVLRTQKGTIILTTTHMSTVDSNKLQYWPGAMFYAGFPSSTSSGVGEL